VGSLNVDLFCYLHDKFPEPGRVRPPHRRLREPFHVEVLTSCYPRIGETLQGSHSATCCGGKGGNQAVMAARLGAPTSMVGMVGRDVFGNTLREALIHDGVSIK